MTDRAPVGRRFTGHRKVRLGDVTASGRLRLDALTRYTQDVSDDDTTDAGLAAEPGWVVRRTTVSVNRAARLGEELTFTTYCSGLGKRWADRTLDVVGSEGASYQVVTLWICVDVASGRPCLLTDEFLDLYAEAAQGRTVSARLVNPKRQEGGRSWVWPLRAVDLDTLGHVNNAAYWAVAEEMLANRARSDDETQPVIVEAADGGMVACVEYAAGLGPDDTVTVHEDDDNGNRLLWLVTGDGTTAASISLADCP